LHTVGIQAGPTGP